MGIWDDIKVTFRKGSNLTKLIYLNAGVFLLITLAAIIGFLMKNQSVPDKALELLAVPASWKLLLVRPWTLITYTFTHKDIWHILFNMLWLYWFGRESLLLYIYLAGSVAQ
jgi:membrane associated rhomboid family serine protease